MNGAVNENQDGTWSGSLGNEALLERLQCVPASLQGWAVGKKGTAELSAQGGTLQHVP